MSSETLSSLHSQLRAYIISVPLWNGLQNFCCLSLSAWFYFDINPLKICHGSSSTLNKALIFGGDLRWGQSALTLGDRRWPLPQGNPSLVWTLWALRLKQRTPGNRLSGIDCEEGPNLPWQTHLILDAILPSLYPGTKQTDFIILTSGSWHTNPRTKGLRGPLIFVFLVKARKPAVTPFRQGMLMDFFKCCHANPLEPFCFCQCRAFEVYRNPQILYLTCL